MRPNRLFIVVPCYNEEEVLPETARRLQDFCEKLRAEGKISAESRVFFVDDGSKDSTWELISGLHEQNTLFDGLRLSRNRGHQNALLAGLLTAKDLADVTISMDADLQDDIAAMAEMLDRYQEGCEIVYGVRSNREKDTWVKRFTAESFYKFLRKMGGEVVFNHADYRLMSRRALEALAEYREVNLYLRGIVPMIGYRSAIVTYERSERFAGETKYPFRKMVALAVNGITSLSVEPIRRILSTGVGAGLLGFLMLLICIIFLMCGKFLDWLLILSALLILGGLQLVAIGIVGEYVGKIYLETKRRPRFQIAEILHREPDENL